MSHVFEGVQVMMHEEELQEILVALDALPSPSTILEYGSGGSTSIFANHLGYTHRLYSVEHDKGWYEKVSERLAGHPNDERITRILAPLQFHQGLWRFAHPYEEMPSGAEYYIWAPENNPEGWSWENVNLVLVDGICRGPCLAYLRTKLNPGTTVFLHDYTGREIWYDWAVKLYDRVKQTNLILELRVPTK
jgi:hypothetical protein